MSLPAKQKPCDLHQLLDIPVRYYFFTGKGGVGKTSIAASTALALADSGKRVLLISTDPASNLDEVFGLELGPEPRLVPQCRGLSALNINPATAAARYREKVVGPMRGILPETALTAMEEQLSGACTMEIAAFDEFTGYLHGDTQNDFDHIVFDTAPTGHTLRLMALSQAWTKFFDENSSGNSCLGPLAGLSKQRKTYAEVVEVLKNPLLTAIHLVSRAVKSALKEARRTFVELRNLGISNQFLIINGWYAPEPCHPLDPVSGFWLERQAAAMDAEAEFIHSLPLYRAPLLSCNLTGVEVLRAFQCCSKSTSMQINESPAGTALPVLPDFGCLVESFASAGHGVVMFMGKGGVGKTTLATALALALADRGLRVRLSTTDPAAHITDALGGDTHIPLTVERIDPKVETAAYVKEVLAAQDANMDADSRAMLEEDLRSPCTEEIAVFRAFGRTVGKGMNEFVVLDTAPTGHTLLLLDATQSYHRELGRQSRLSELSEDVVTLLPRLRDPSFTRILLVTLAENTPVHEAAALQEDLRRAKIEPYAWVINQSLAASGTTEPLLCGRGHAEIPCIREAVESNSSKVTYLVPWTSVEPCGLAGLRHLTANTDIKTPL